jgi:hypothetical protein
VMSKLDALVSRFLYEALNLNSGNLVRIASSNPWSFCVIQTKMRHFCFPRVQQMDPSPSKNPANHSNVMRSITKHPPMPERFLAAKSGQSD